MVIYIIKNMSYARILSPKDLVRMVSGLFWMEVQGMVFVVQTLVVSLGRCLCLTLLEGHHVAVLMEKRKFLGPAKLCSHKVYARREKFCFLPTSILESLFVRTNVLVNPFRTVPHMKEEKLNMD
jgi:hypothetical protein